MLHILKVHVHRVVLIRRGVVHHFGIQRDGIGVSFGVASIIADRCGHIQIVGALRDLTCGKVIGPIAVCIRDSGAACGAEGDGDSLACGRGPCDGNPIRTLVLVDDVVGLDRRVAELHKTCVGIDADRGRCRIGVANRIGRGHGNGRVIFAIGQGARLIGYGPVAAVVSGCRAGDTFDENLNSCACFCCAGNGNACGGFCCVHNVITTGKTSVDGHFGLGVHFDRGGGRSGVTHCIGGGHGDIRIIFPTRQAAGFVSNAPVAVGVCGCGPCHPFDDDLDRGARFGGAGDRDASACLGCADNVIAACKVAVDGDCGFCVDGNGGLRGGAIACCIGGCH